MKAIGSRIFLALLLTDAISAQSTAQRNNNYAVKEMNFDLWCQLQANLPAARCDKRTAQDEATFQAYRAKVEAYEIPYLQRKNADARLDRSSLHADPIGPLRNDPAARRPDLDNHATTSTLPTR